MMYRCPSASGMNRGPRLKKKSGSLLCKPLLLLDRCCSQSCPQLADCRLQLQAIQRLPTAANASHQMDPNAQPLPHQHAAKMIEMMADVAALRQKWAPPTAGFGSSDDEEPARPADDDADDGDAPATAPVPPPPAPPVPSPAPAPAAEPPQAAAPKISFAAAGPAPEPAADPAQARPAAFFELQKLQKEILAVYTTPGYGKNTLIGDVRSIIDDYGFTNRGRSWERGSLRLYPPEHFPQSQEGCIRSFNGLKTYLDSALAEASPSHP
jgi:hypothetical protein